MKNQMKKLKLAIVVREDTLDFFFTSSSATIKFQLWVCVCFVFLAAPEPSEAVEPNGLEEEPEEKAAPAEKPEIVSWRRKPDEEGGRASSPSRKRYSPDRRRRQNGWYTTND